MPSAWTPQARRADGSVAKSHGVSLLRDGDHLAKARVTVFGLPAGFSGVAKVLR
ncbi:MAG TPA: hypothetical protein PKN13_01480 [Accumulibacter sp.]|nr:hypothetical protein [Accumulibacter sp.]HNC16851.1 hypothetical protein [Accumulibacter sp.]HND79283.1 hypothetical protein [Accumulibacter sp.]HNE11848.1 hypothetical protein [Accumulibacter sp.]HNG38229.1 hypothetical protein [Accumulibacter sp.]